MAYFPLYIDLKKRRCLVIGGGQVAWRKIQTLLQFEAEIVVISAAVVPEIQQLHDLRKLTYWKKSYQNGDLSGFFLVIAATSDPALNDAVYDDAVRMNVWVNSADDPEKCTFVFPAVVKNDALVVGVTSSGRFPALTRLLREKIASFAIFQRETALETWAEFRRKIQTEVADPDKRRQLLRAAGRAILDDPAGDPRMVLEKIDGEKRDAEA